MSEKFLITSALPYANGPLHFGHIAGVYLPADIYTRHRKLQGYEAIHISGSDEHGVAIMLNANEKKVPYKEYVDTWHKEHFELFKDYQIEFDFFGQTSEKYHEEETLRWFNELYKKGFIEKGFEEQLQCQSCSQYLPDRFVEGECYECGYKEARGDECPDCGTWIEPARLINPICKFCGSADIKPVQVFQWYLKLSKFHEQYRGWLLKKTHWRKTVMSYLDSLSEENLVDRAITRDLDWGIDVPLEEAKGKKLYVWFDAPIGYVSNTKEWIKVSGRDDDYLRDWWQNPKTKITNFIGKDNIIFHGIIFPMMSLASGFANPVTDLPANQYLNLQGRQFSKSKGWDVDAKKALEEFGSDALRFYLTTLIPETTDSSFTWEGFEARVNNELANNIGNFVNRSLKFFYKNWKEGIEGEVFSSFFKSEKWEALKGKHKDFEASLEKIKIKEALGILMGIGQDANGYFSEREPWAKIKTEPEDARQTIAGSAVYTLALGSLFRPFLPELASSILSFFDEEKGEKAANDFYQGKFQDFENFFSERIKLPKKPKGLVPKIAAEVIEKKNEELEGKKQK